MKLDELRKRLRSTEPPAGPIKPPLGRTPYCAGCMKRLDKCEGRETCKGFLPDHAAEMLEVGDEVIERMRHTRACIRCKGVVDADDPSMGVLCRGCIRAALSLPKRSAKP